MRILYIITKLSPQPYSYGSEKLLNSAETLLHNLWYKNKMKRNDGK